MPYNDSVNEEQGVTDHEYNLAISESLDPMKKGKFTAGQYTEE